MLFNSIPFIIFFPVVVGLYFAIPHRFRWALLLTASYYFYMCWKPEYVLLIIASTLVDYFAALQMGKYSDRVKRKPFLIISLIVNLGLLFSFKYFNFFNESFRTLFDSVDIFYNVPSFNVLLPVGISFYTFQTLSYSIDVYRGKKTPERHLGIFALYVAFFPQLVAGPIERSTRLLPQFFNKYNFDYVRVTNGLKLMLWGFFKKLVIADRIAEVVNHVYSNPSGFEGVALLIATYLFAVQIYCDFSGYSDIAIGAAQVFGIKLMRNFKRPYYAKSIAEFWQRWHISLSTWFRDYLYKSIGGNRVPRWRWHYNILIVFVISGLWHGANWTFIIWGALHGSYYLISKWTLNIRARLSSVLKLDSFPFVQKLVRVFITFNLVSFAWIFFRANSLADAYYIITHLFKNILSVLSNLSAVGTGQGIISTGIGLDRGELLIAGLAIIIMEIAHLIQRKQSVLVWLANKHIVLRWSIYYFIIFFILVFGYFNLNEFIYFQF
jgi:D-alanyl-lipoteichoic acid acyltransferase DltB (MBOAT superfamily)